MITKQQLSILGGLSTISKKVYAATPISDGWTSQQIRAELMRNGSANIDVKTVRGCLDGLKKDGLVRESLQGGKSCLRNQSIKASSNLSVKNTALCQRKSQ